jgi:hypothetical protein
MRPSPAKPVHEELSDEGRGKLSQGNDGKVHKLVAGQIFHIHLTSDVKEVIHSPVKC